MSGGGDFKLTVLAVGDAHYLVCALFPDGDWIELGTYTDRPAAYARRRVVQREFDAFDATVPGALLHSPKAPILATLLVWQRLDCEAFNSLREPLRIEASSLGHEPSDAHIDRWRRDDSRP